MLETLGKYNTKQIWIINTIIICIAWFVYLSGFHHLYKRSAYGFGLRKEFLSLCLIDKICFNIYNYLIGGVGMKEFLYNSSIENNKHYISVFG